MRGSNLLATVVLIAVAVGLGLPDVAPAQQRKDSFEWSVFAGESLFDSEMDLRGSFLYGTRFGINFTERYELEFRGAYTSTRHDRDPRQGKVQLFEITTAALFNFPGHKDNNWRWAPYAYLGLGMSAYNYQHFHTQQDMHIAWGGGVRWFGTEKVALRFEALGLTEIGGDWTNAAVTLGLSFVSGGKLRDSDGDTVPDSKDFCPNTPMGCIVNAHGCERDGDADGICDGLDECPETRVRCLVDTLGCDLDGDGDGVCDGIDECPETPKGCKVDAVGCEKDSDGDGVCNGVDKCPGTPKGCKVDAKGCELDADRDGVCDGLDECPRTPRGCRVDAKGCPKDEDGDGVCDGVDKCPGTPRGMQVDKRGCETELNFPAIQFDFNRSLVKDGYVPILEKAAKAMKDNRRLKVLLIGHTDDVGGEAYNLKLAARRAEAVKTWLGETAGIDASRLETEGQGECCPVAPNESPEGRYKNRRVEFRRIR